MNTLELCAEALVGFRHWAAAGDYGVYPGGSGLYPSTDYGGCKAWPDDGVQHSSVPSLDHESMHADCGIHAYYQPRPSFYEIAGAVVAWGWVVEHEWGFRAQHAKVIALEELEAEDWMTEYVARAAKRYGLPVLPEPELVEYGKWWGEVREEA